MNDKSCCVLCSNLNRISMLNKHCVLCNVQNNISCRESSSLMMDIFSSSRNVSIFKNASFCDYCSLVDIYAISCNSSCITGCHRSCFKYCCCCSMSCCSSCSSCSSSNSGSISCSTCCGSSWSCMSNDSISSTSGYAIAKVQVFIHHIQVTTYILHVLANIGGGLRVAADFFTTFYIF